MSEHELAHVAHQFALQLSATAPGWTDHNDHDPGVTLIELFAFLSEQLLFRSNQIPERGHRAITRTIAALEQLGGGRRAAEP